MALPTNLQRPVVPYTPTQVGAFIDRYTALDERPPQGFAVDGDMNFIVDSLNATNDAVNGVAVGILPGADEEINANKLPTTDGEGNISWTLVENQHMDDNCCNTRNYLDSSITSAKIVNQNITSNLIAVQAVTTDKIANAAVTTNQIANLAITNPLIANAAVGTNQIANAAVTTGKIANASITTPLIANLAITNPLIANAAVGTNQIANLAITNPLIAATSVTVDKINSGAAAAGTVLTALAGNGAIFSALPFKGIKQIQSTTIAQAANTPVGATTFQQFSTPLQVSITTQSANSTVVILLSANMGASATDGIYPNNVYGALYKNGAILNAASGTPVGVQISGLQQSLVQALYHTVNINTIFMDSVANAGTTNTYSLRCYSSRVNGRILLNTSADNTGVAGISYITALEIGS